MDHYIQSCQYSPPNGIRGLQVLDDDTIKWFLPSCPNRLIIGYHSYPHVIFGLSNRSVYAIERACGMSGY